MGVFDHEKFDETGLIFPPALDPQLQPSMKYPWDGQVSKKFEIPKSTHFDYLGVLWHEKFNFDIISCKKNASQL